MSDYTIKKDLTEEAGRYFDYVIIHRHKIARLRKELDEEIVKEASAVERHNRYVNALDALKDPKDRKDAA